MKVLLVEDDPGEQWIISEILRSRGHGVTACKTAESGWDRFTEEPYSLILLDLILPGMDGLELCRRIRKHPRGDETVVVVVTGRDEPEDLQEVLRAGADDYVTKPIDVGLLNIRLAIAENEVADVEVRKRTKEKLEAKRRELGRLFQKLDEGAFTVGDDGTLERVGARETLAELERERRILARRLKRANEELDAFIDSVSHDLRRPLRTMQGFAHALLDDHGDGMDPEALDYVRRIVASGERSEALIRDLLAYSRLGLEEMKLQPVDLGEVVEAALEKLAAAIEERSATVRVPDALPRVRAHQRTLTSVLFNLLDNAVKFVPPDRAPEVSVGVEEREGHLRLWVEDNGPGIPPDQAERIFRAFERLARDQEASGTGIGLAIARKGMERLGGTAGIEPADGPGSRFWLEIPLTR